MTPYWAATGSVLLIEGRRLSDTVGLQRETVITEKEEPYVQCLPIGVGAPHGAVADWTR